MRFIWCWINLCGGSPEVSLPGRHVRIVWVVQWPWDGLDWGFWTRQGRWESTLKRPWTHDKRPWEVAHYKWETSPNVFVCLRACFCGVGKRLKGLGWSSCHPLRRSKCSSIHHVSPYGQRAMVSPTICDKHPLGLCRTKSHHGSFCQWRMK